jgi:hypothetical protein
MLCGHFYSPVTPGAECEMLVLAGAERNVLAQTMSSLANSQSIAARCEYCMTPEEFEALKEACNPRIALGDAKLVREHAQRRAQAVWEQMGAKYGFDWTTTQPVQGKHHGFFTAQPLTTAETSAKQ